MIDGWMDGKRPLLRQGRCRLVCASLATEQAVPTVAPLVQAVIIGGWWCRHVCQWTATAGASIKKFDASGEITTRLLDVLFS